MFQNSFTILFRRLKRNRTFTLINVLGLAVGIAASLLIFLVIRNELTYDGFHNKKDRIYRVVTTNVNRSNGEPVSYNGSVPVLLPDALRTDFPQIEKVAAVWALGGAQIYIPGKDLAHEKRFKENQGNFFIEPSFFELFDFQWLEGNATALSQPNTVVLNETSAKNYFGSSKNAIGQTIQMWSFRIPLRVVGVFKDLQDNTDIPVRMAASYATFRNLNKQMFNDPFSWTSNWWSSECFVLLPPNLPVQSLQAQLPHLVKKYYNEEQHQLYTRAKLSFQPLKEMHLDNRFDTFRGDAISKKDLWALGLIGMFLLLVACINFINLATAQSVNRAKEIGVRKVLGSNRPALLKQFLGETALITLLALVLGYVLALLALPYLCRLVNKPLSLSLAQSPVVVLFLLLTGAVVTCLAGFYPGLVLSRFNPIKAIKSKVKVGGISLRRSLVVTQFVIAQLLIIGTFVVVQQMRYFRSWPLGFEKEAIALIDLPSDSLDKLKYHYLTQQLQKVPGVQAASLCMDAPSNYGGMVTSFFFDNKPHKEDFNIEMQCADTAYLNTFRLQLLAGRIPYASDSLKELLVNETAVKALGLKSPRDIIGKNITFENPTQVCQVVGVLRDFNSRPLREAPRPLVLGTSFPAYSTVAVRMNPANLKTTLEQVHAAFTGVFPSYLYDCSFFDDRIAGFYKSEAVTSALFSSFAALAIFISCLGLYGLVSFMAVQKTREVGIRKVLGASVKSILLLFSKEFTLLVGIAFFIAAPLGYYLMHQWLSGFYYHIRPGIGVFALAIGLSVAVAWLTVGYKAFKAAVANPVNSLKAE